MKFAEQRKKIIEVSFIKNKNIINNGKNNRKRY